MSKKKKKFQPKDKARKRICPLINAGIDEIDYKDVELLKQFITEKGKIIPKRISGLSARSQKRITWAIKRARNVALLSFAEGYITQDEPKE